MKTTLKYLRIIIGIAYIYLGFLNNIIFNYSIFDSSTRLIAIFLSSFEISIGLFLVIQTRDGILRLLSRLFVGTVFIFSGFVKGVDPFGFTYKFIDYFEAFHISFFNPIALPLSIILSSAEFVIGIGLIVSVRMKETSWALLVFMVFFTVLTFILAIFNPVSDCGCFGDAIILTNWQTFFKNIILMVPVMVIFLNRNKIISQYNNLIQWGIIGAYSLIIISISIYCITHLPILDFRPYNVGAHIPEKMEYPENAPRDEYEIKLYYKKENITKEFTIETIPDSTWEFVRTESKLIKKGYEPPIHDFSISDIETGEDISDIILDDDGYVFIAIMYNLNKTNTKKINEINKLGSFGEMNNYKILGITSSSVEEIESFKETHQISFPFFNADEVTLKTIIRANPGLILLHKGIILGKWHFNDIPPIKTFEKNIIALSINEINSKRENKITVIYILLLLLTIILLKSQTKLFTANR